MALGFHKDSLEKQIIFFSLDFFESIFGQEVYRIMSKCQGP